MQTYPNVRSSFPLYLLVLPTLFLLAVFSFLPVLMAFYNSFFEYEVGGERTWVGFQNYIDYLIADPTTVISFVNMGLLTLIAIVIRLTAPLIVAKCD